MASSGKKGKKSKGKTLALNDFLQETPGPAPTIPIRKSGLNWAEEVEDTYENYDSSRIKQQVILPTAPKAARGIDDYSDKIPHQPPYIAYLSNLPYDVDEDEIAEFFSNMRIANMRIPKEDRPGEAPKLRGFGYVEFEDRDSLLCALAIPDCTLKNRRIRIEVATNSENERRRGGRMDSNRERPDRPEVSMGNWRSGPRVDSAENSDRGTGGGGGGGGGFNRDRDRERDAPSERGWRDGDRPNFRDNRDNYNDRSRYDRGFGPSRRNDREDKNGGMTRNRDDAPPAERSEPRMRQKLNLAPRTKPIENIAPPAAEETTDSTKSTTASSAASIFGNAKPVDTTAKEREIEERLAKEQEKEKVVDTAVEKREVKKDDEKRKRDDEIRRSPRRSPERKYSPKRISPGRNKYSPDRNRSSERRRSSPERRRGSPEKSRVPAAPRRIVADDKRGPTKVDRLPPRDKNERSEKPKREEKPPREYTERDMPKVKQPEPQNFVTSNQYAFLETEDISD